MDYRAEIEKILPLVEKPARYIGGEQGSVRKSHDGKLLLALAFPEPYEIGMSHFGGQIIYHIVNSADELICERVYMPWDDMRQMMRQRGIPLISIESKTALRNFDVVGFTLENDMSYTNILEMLELGGIPVLAHERTDDEPIVIGGGIGAYRPEPLADFFDAFFIGDAEAGFVGILRNIKSLRDAGKRRDEIIRALSQFHGIYVPSLYEARYDNGKFSGMAPCGDAPMPIKPAIAPRLEKSSYPMPPIAPWIEIVHDRLRAELNRGCGRGCRFCDAGFLYRPVRERAPDEVIAELRKNYDNTGWEECGVLSLSATDYTAIALFLDGIKDWGNSERIKFSFPSLRVEQLDNTAFDVFGAMRKSGLTLAPEAGTERLRAAINKPIAKDELLATIETAFKHKWRSIKLYFMLGLPTETDADIAGIIEIIGNAGSRARRYGGKIRATISPFVPKPHTPFQWEPQFDVDEIKRREELILRNAPRNVEISARNPLLSVIEGIISRGDRRIGKVLLSAWRKGAIYASWSEFFNPGIFFESMAENDLSPVEFTRARNPDEPLPWSIIDKGISRDFLLAERGRAFAGELTPPCRTRDCAKCRFCDLPPQVLTSPTDIESRCNDKNGDGIRYGRKLRREKPKQSGIVVQIARVKYSRRGMTRFIGHLDTLRIWERILRRAKFPLLFSEGYHVRPKIMSSPPLHMNCESEAEYLDISLAGELTQEHIGALARNMPDGFSMVGCKLLSHKPRAMQAAVEMAVWKCTLRTMSQSLADVFEQLFARKSIEFDRHGKALDIRPLMVKWRIQPDGNDAIITMLLKAGDAGSGRPQEFLCAAGIDENIVAQGRHIRIELLIPTSDGWTNPMGERIELPL